MAKFEGVFRAVDEVLLLVEDAAIVIDFFLVRLRFEVATLIVIQELLLVFLLLSADMRISL